MRRWQKGCLLAVLSLMILLLGFAGLSGANQEKEGYSKLFQEKCQTCHSLNEQGQVSRIDFMRKTPEGWEDTIKRMERVWGAALTREETKSLVVELSGKRGLAPAESAPVLAMLAEKRSYLEAYPDNEAVVMACAGACHTYGRIAAQRRTTEEWHKLKDFHMGTNPGILLQMRSMDWSNLATEAINFFAENFPLETEAYQTWQNQKKEEAAGQWGISGTQPGKGNYSGKLTLTKLDEINYQVNRQVIYADGQTEEWSGNGVLFGDYSLRASMSNGDDKFKLVSLLHGAGAEGSWRHLSDSGLHGDEIYVRLDSSAKLLGASKAGLIAGTEEIVTLWGSNLPARIAVKDIQVSHQGLDVVEVTKATADTVVLKVKAAAAAAADRATITIPGVAGAVQVNVGQVDYIKINPEFGLARVGGIVFSKQGVQFEAIAYTADGLSLGPVPADWSLERAEELPFEDDVLKWVGSIDKNGYFTPGLDGPNPERPLSANNTGALMVIAQFNVPGSEQVLEAEAQLLAAIQNYRIVN